MTISLLALRKWIISASSACSAGVLKDNVDEGWCSIGCVMPRMSVLGDADIAEVGVYEAFDRDWIGMDRHRLYHACTYG